MGTRVQDQSPYKRGFEKMLSNDIRPFLREHGYSKNGHRFYRQRPPLYDQIHFQGNYYNNINPYGFFVNVDIGSTDVDALAPCLGSRTPPDSFLLSHRWWYLVKGLPGEVRFTSTADIPQTAADVRHGLARLIAELDTFNTTETLVQFMVAHTKLLAYKRVCRYLSATNDITTLRRYITTLRDSFGHETRWTIFNNTLIQAAGAMAPTLIADGLLTPSPSGTH